MPRKTRVLTTAVPGANGPSIEANLDRVSSLLERACTGRPDIICLPEAFARRYSTYIICPLIEKRGSFLYNFAVILDR